MDRQMRHTSSLRQSRNLRTANSLRFSISRRGSVIVTLVADNHGTKLAFRMAMALLRPQDELQLVTVVANEDSTQYGKNLLAQYLQEQCENTVTPVVLVKGDERMDEVLSQYIKSSSADLLVLGSHNLCVTGTRDDPLPATGSFAMKLVKSVRCCPVLVVKANSRGPYLHSGNAAMGLKVMVECQPHSRHMLAWLMDKMNPDTDGIFLAVLKAHDLGTGGVKETANRMLNNFSVQASVNDFYTAQRVYKEASQKALPQAVEADAIDILALQAPDCKLLPDSITDLLNNTRSSILIYNQKAEPSAAAVAAAAGALGSANAALAEAAAAAVQATTETDKVAAPSPLPRRTVEFEV